MKLYIPLHLLPGQCRPRSWVGLQPAWARQLRWACRRLRLRLRLRLHLPLQRLPLLPCKWLLVWFHQQTPVACRLWQACRQLRPRLCLQQLYLPPCLLVA